MLDVRPIVVDENWTVLGGNMRLRALQELKVAKVPVTQVTDWTEDQKKEFVIKDNLAFGEWDWDVLANEWDADTLNDWGLEVWTPNGEDSLDEFFEQEPSEGEHPEKYRITLEFTEEDGPLVKEKLLAIASTPEQALWKLLDL